MAVKERSQIKGTDAQIKAFAGHNGVLAFATDTKSLHVLSGTAGTTTEFLPSTKVATKTELANYTPTASLATVATSGSYNDLSDKPVVDSALSSTSKNPVQNKVINSALDGKLSLSGGTMTGDISFIGNGEIKSATNKGGRLVIETVGSSLHGSNVSYEDGAALLLRSSAYPNDQKGLFFLIAGLSSSQHYMLIGSPDGSLEWGGHNVITVVVEYYGANSWYRKYSDGWIEQGGKAEFPSQGDLSITLPLAFSNPYYTPIFRTNSSSDFWLASISPTYFSIGTSTGYGVSDVWWRACGN